MAEDLRLKKNYIYMHLPVLTFIPTNSNANLDTLMFNVSELACNYQGAFRERGSAGSGSGGGAGLVGWLVGRGVWSILGMGWIVGEVVGEI